MWVAFGASLWGTDTVFRQPLTATLSSSQIVLFEHLILSVLLAVPLYLIRSQWLAQFSRPPLIKENSMG